jgi:hypothetical protein
LIALGLLIRVLSVAAIGSRYPFSEVGYEILAPALPEAHLPLVPGSSMLPHARRLPDLPGQS